MLISLRTKAGIALVVASLGLGCGGNHSSKLKGQPISNNDNNQTIKEKDKEQKQKQEKAKDLTEEQTDNQVSNAQYVKSSNGDDGDDGASGGITNNNKDNALNSDNTQSKATNNPTINLKQQYTHDNAKALCKTLGNNPLCNIPITDKCFKAKDNGLQPTSQELLIKEAKSISIILGDTPPYMEMEDNKLPTRRKEFINLSNEQALSCIQEHLHAICTNKVNLTNFSSQLATWSKEAIAQELDDVSYLKTLSKVADAIWIDKIEKAQNHKYYAISAMTGAAIATVSMPTYYGIKRIKHRRELAAITAAAGAKVVAEKEDIVGVKNKEQPKVDVVPKEEVQQQPDANQIAINIVKSEVVVDQQQSANMLTNDATNPIRYDEQSATTLDPKTQDLIKTDDDVVPKEVVQPQLIVQVETHDVVPQVDPIQVVNDQNLDVQAMESSLGSSAVTIQQQTPDGGDSYIQTLRQFIAGKATPNHKSSEKRCEAFVNVMQENAKLIVESPSCSKYLNRTIELACNKELDGINFDVKNIIGNLPNDQIDAQTKFNLIQKLLEQMDRYINSPGSPAFKENVAVIKEKFILETASFIRKFIPIPATPLQPGSSTLAESGTLNGSLDHSQNGE